MGQLVLVRVAGVLAGPGEPGDVCLCGAPEWLSNSDSA